MKSFSEKYKITYPLLSDSGSVIIKKYGILNTKIDSTRRSYGIPNPGIYFIDENFYVVKKLFEQDYSARPTAENVLSAFFNKDLNKLSQKFSTSYLNAKIAISDSVVFRGQVLAFTAAFHLKPGFHLYGTPVPEGYIPLTITFDENPNFSVDSLSFPATEKKTLKSLGETFHILPEKFEIKTSVRMVKRPEFGEVPLTVKISFQACDDKLCMPPEDFEINYLLQIKQANL